MKSTYKPPNKELDFMNAKAEQEPQISENVYYKLFDVIEEAVQISELVFDEKGKPIDNIILDVNPAYEKHSGLRKEHVIGRRIKEILPVVEHIWLERYAEIIRSGKGIHFEEYNASLEKWFEVSANPIGGNRVIAVFKNITERKLAEEALRKSEERFHTMANAIPQLAWIAQPDGSTTWYNDRWYAYTGTTPEQMEGWGWQNVHDPTVLPIVLKQWKASIATGQPFDIEFPLRGVDGLYRVFLTRAFPLKDAKGQVLQWFGTNTDITERKQEEHRILRYIRIQEGINRIFSNVVQAKTEEELGNTCLSVALELTGGGIGFINLIGDDRLMHDIAISEGGWNQCLTHDQIGHRRPSGNFIVHGLYGHVVTSGKGFFTNNPPSHPQSIGLPLGHPELTSFLGVPLFQEGKAIGMLAVANREGGYSSEQLEDLEAIAPAVTQALKRKKAEEDLKKTLDNLDKLVIERTAELEQAYNSLKESERNLSEAQKMGHFGSWERNIATNKLHWSDEMYRIFGLKPQELEMNYELLLNHFVHPDDRDYLDNAVKGALNGTPYSINYRIILRNGEERIVHVKGEVDFDDQNYPIRIKGTTQDITESKRTEEKIHHLANVVESSSDAIGTLSLNGITTSWNKGAEQIYGYLAEEILGKHINLPAPPHLKNETQEYVELIKQTGISYRYITSRMRNDGEMIELSITLSPVFDSKGKLTAISFISRDITEQKKAEEALRESEERLRFAHHASKIGAFEWNIQTGVNIWTPELEAMYGLQPGEFAKTEEAWEQLVHPEDRQKAIRIVDQAIKTCEPTEHEWRVIWSDGNVHWLSGRFQAYKDATGNPLRLTGINIDITEKKITEQLLAEMVIARKKEIHHRIKNNLQVISSLLDLQAEKFKGKKCITDSEFLEAFKESQDRVISMALIHEELHNSGDMNTINISKYIDELTDNLFLTYRLGNENTKLIKNTEENVFFNMDVSVPLGLIINELISNSFKYAFVGRDTGEIQIKLKRQENRKCNNEDCKSTTFVLTISDNGIGIPEDLNIEDLDSLGLQLVTTLVDQLDGELELNRDNGTEFIIRFAVTEKDNQAPAPSPQSVDND